MIIFGAGLSGLIAARMLADRNPTILERQSALPNNHHAILRFRSTDVSLATNIPFDKVKVLKAVAGSENQVSDAVRYSKKVTGGYHNRSVLSLEPSTRYIAPPDFISRLARPLEGGNIAYDIDFESWSDNLWKSHPPVISTIPMPVMMDLFEWKPRPEFKRSAGWTVKAWIKTDIPCAMNATVYFPEPEFPAYRSSVTGREIMIEGVGERPDAAATMDVLNTCVKAMGFAPSDLGDLVSCKPSSYQKIMDLTPDERESAKRFVMWLSEKHQVYSLGRFAVWRPKLLLDDIPNDVRVIERLIDGSANYNARIA